MSMAKPQFSQKSRRTPQSPISYFMEQAIENPQLISLAAGLVDSHSLPAGPISEVVSELLGDPHIAKQALQYGTTQGNLALRERILGHIAKLDGVDPRTQGVSPKEVVITTGSQQMLYMLGEILLDPGDIVLTEAPSYFVFHAVLAGNGVRVLAVPMDEDGMIIERLAEVLEKLDRAGELQKVKLLYTVDYFQNPTGITLKQSRRQQLMDLLNKYQSRQRILVLEDAAYRELRYDGDEIPSLKSLDRNNEFVIYAGTFSKPCSPGLKTGYSLLPKDLIEPLIRLKGNHDFGSGNLSQFIINRLMENGAYYKHVQHLLGVYRAKRAAMLDTLAEEFRDHPEVKWTRPNGGMFTWFSLPKGTSTGAGSPFFKAAIAEGVLYIPGEYGFVGENLTPETNHARLSFGDATPEDIRKGVRCLRRSFESVLTQGKTVEAKRIA